MSLRIRRGTNTQRVARNFDLGELVYTTDTKQLYVGDGITTGGVNILASSAGPGLEWDSATQKFRLGSSNLTTLNIIEDIDGGKFFTYQRAVSAVGNELETSPDHSGISFALINNRIVATVEPPTITTSVVDEGTNLYYTNERVGDEIAALISRGTATGISVTYNDGAESGAGSLSFDTSVKYDTTFATAVGTIVGNMVLGGTSSGISILYDGTAQAFNYTVATYADTYEANKLGGLDHAAAEIRFSDGFDERITLVSSTTGELSAAGQVLFRNYKGTLADPLPTIAGDTLGGWTIEGVTTEGAKGATYAFASWGQDADMLTPFPSSSFAIFTGSNSEAPNQLLFSDRGVLSAPFIKATSYDTPNIPADPEVGCIIFDSTTQKFKGFVSDVGLATTGVSNTVSGWIDLN